MTARCHSLTPTTQKGHDMTLFTETLTDSDGDECSFMHHDQPDQDATSGVYVRTSADGEVISAGPFTPEALHAALDEVAPAGSDTRTRSLRNDRHYWQARAEKAEHYRDQYRDDAIKAEDERDDLAAQLQAHEPAVIEKVRPLTADAIESVLHDILPLSTERLGADDIANIASDLYTALTEPTRPEGAEELAEAIAEWDETGVVVRSLDQADTDELADHLAVLGYRKTGDES